MLWGLYEFRIRQLAREFNMSLEARVSERTRIARDLHDTLLQSFHGLLLRFQTVSNVLPPGDAKEKLTARSTTPPKRSLRAGCGARAACIHGREQRPCPRHHGPLAKNLRPMRPNQSLVQFSVEVEGAPRNLHPILRDEVYRIAGEALRNAFRHARAQRIEVEIHYDERRASIACPG